MPFVMVTVREIGVFDNDKEGVGDIFLFFFFFLIGGGDFVCRLREILEKEFSQVWLVRFRFLFNFGFINLIGCNCSTLRWCYVVGLKSNCKIGPVNNYTYTYMQFINARFIFFLSVIDGCFLCLLYII